VTGSHTEIYIHIGKKYWNIRQSILNRKTIREEGNFKPGNAFRGLNFSPLQKFGPEQLLLTSCMTGLGYFLSKELTSVTVEG
jgi:hypothetical protein